MSWPVSVQPRLEFAVSRTTDSAQLRAAADLRAAGVLSVSGRSIILLGAGV